MLSVSDSKRAESGAKSRVSEAKMLICFCVEITRGGGVSWGGGNGGGGGGMGKDE